MTNSFSFADLLNEAKSASFDVLPDGMYDVEIAEANPVAASTGKPMVKVRLKVLTGPHAGTTIFDQHTLSVDNPKALAMFFRKMSALGLGEQFFATLPSHGTPEQIMTPVAQAMLGRRARVSVTSEPWPKGQTEQRQNRVGMYSAASGQTQGGAPGLPGLPGLPSALPTAPAGLPTAAAPIATPAAAPSAVPAPIPAPIPAPAPVAAPPAPAPIPAPVAAPTPAPAALPVAEPAPASAPIPVPAPVQPAPVPVPAPAPAPIEPPAPQPQSVAPPLQAPIIPAPTPVAVSQPTAPPVAEAAPVAAPAPPPLPF